MTSAEIRQSFLDFFKSKGHSIVPSASLLPSSPNLLFTNAGMNPFVPYFLGERTPAAPRVANTQKCIRAGGKHNDLEDVGFDTYHHTFFEMLGNWSFGDYFKQEAITWAWELLTEVWHFPKERLYASVYKPSVGDTSADFDQEAFDCWKAIFENAGLDPDVHIVYGNKKDNFWMMGETGPCGPCSEVHMDLTPEGDTRGGLVNQDSPWCIEIWNLVFIQLNAEEGGAFKPLSACHVDTGMGLERLAGIIATTKGFTDFSQMPSNYASDLFTDLFGEITKMSGHTYGHTTPEVRTELSEAQMKDCAFRVLADHIRTLCLGIADGILPGNEGRNYVLRRILRRAVLFGQRLDLKEGFLAKLADTVIEKLGPVFSELREQREPITRVIQSEEQAFERTLGRGLQLIDKITSERSAITGEEAFTLYDTYGFPIDLTQLIARERNLELDLDGFEEAMQEQRSRAQAAQKKSVIRLSEDSDEVSDATQFVGFDNEKLSDFESTVSNLVQRGDAAFLVFEKTPFYAEMGGQIGDSGEVVLSDQTFAICDTIRDAHGQFLHRVDGESSESWVGQPALLSVNRERRRAIQRHHSATHIFHWALRTVIGTHTRQTGSLVTDKRLRFDFAHYESLKPEQIHRIEMLVNQRIFENERVSWYEVPFDEKPTECLAFFGDKYGSLVRVVDIGGYSLELCGGTHVQATGEIGLFKILSETAIAAGTRRIEAVVGESVLSLLDANFNVLQDLAQRLSCKTDEVSERVEALLDQRMTLEKKVKRFEQKEVATQADRLAEQAQDRDGLDWVVAQVEVDAPASMRGLAVQIAKKMGPGVVILGGIFGDGVNVLALCSPEAIAAGHKAGDIVRDIMGQLGGRGGGKPDFAMGGAKNSKDFAKVLRNYLRL